MHLKLRGGDYVSDGEGGFLVNEGDGELLEQALFLLTARRGGYPLMPELGSRLYLLPREKPAAREGAARTYIQEALEPMGFSVTEVSVVEGDVLMVSAQVQRQGQSGVLEVQVQ